MELNYVFTEKDFEFYKCVTLDSLKDKVKLEKRYHYLLLLIYLLISVSGFIKLGYTQFIFHWIAFTLVIIFLTLITNGKRILYKNYQKVTYKEKEIKQEMFILVTNEYISLKDFENFEYYLLINDIITINKSIEYLIIYTKKANMIIPLRVFNSMNDDEDFINALINKNNKIKITYKEYQ